MSIATILHAPIEQPASEPGATSLSEDASAYLHEARIPVTLRNRRAGVLGFTRQFGDLDRWRSAPVTQRRQVRTEVASFAGHAVIACGFPVDVEFVVTSGCRWGKYLRDAYPDQADLFDEQAASLGFCAKEIGRMWSWLAKICVTTGTSPEGLTATQYQQARAAVQDTVITQRGYRPQSLSTPLFGLDAVMFHRGQAPAPDIRRRWTGRPVNEVDWDDLAAAASMMVATMRRYLRQCSLSLRPSSVVLFDTFSFLPARTADSASMRFARPTIRLPGYINPACRQNPSGARRSRTLDEARQIWGSCETRC